VGYEAEPSNQADPTVAKDLISAIQQTCGRPFRRCRETRAERERRRECRANGKPPTRAERRRAFHAERSYESRVEHTPGQPTRAPHTSFSLAPT
jgi:hypothetical protein